MKKHIIYSESKISNIQTSHQTDFKKLQEYDKSMVKLFFLLTSVLLGTYNWNCKKNVIKKVKIIKISIFNYQGNLYQYYHVYLNIKLSNYLHHDQQF